MSRVQLSILVLAGLVGPTALAFAFQSVGMDTPESGAHAASAAGSHGLSPVDPAELRRRIDADRHSFRPIEGGHRADSPSQRWRTTFDRAGFTTRPYGGGWAWGLELLSYGWGERRVDVEAASAPIASGTRLERNRDERLFEWFVNDGRGLEHGFTVCERPVDASGALELAFAVRGELVPSVAGGERDIDFLDSSGRLTVGYRGLTVVDALGADVPAAWVFDGTGLRLLVDERDAIYPLTIDPIAQQGYLKATNTDAFDNFGSAVAVDGDTAVVGAESEQSNATGVDGNQADDSLGDAGAAYVYVRNGSSWAPQAYLKPSNTKGDDFFGFALDVSGDTIAVGCWGDDSDATGVDGDPFNSGASNAGAVFVFTRSGSVWSQQAYIKASNTEAGDRFGYDVALNGDTLVVGAWGEDSGSGGIDGDQSDDSVANSGAVYVFERSGTTWAQSTYIKAASPQIDASFFNVDVDGDTLVVGALGEDGPAVDCGAVHVLVRSGATWVQQAQLTASNAGPGDGLHSVSIHGDTIVAGATAEDSAATGVNGDPFSEGASDSGAVYVFERVAGTWSQTAYLKASNTGSLDSFGNAVGVCGDRIVVGARNEDSNAKGVNGPQANDSLLGSGAAYVFERAGGVWSQSAYLKAWRPGFGYAFGMRLDLSGSTALIGSDFEDSAATGVDGDPSNQLAQESGAAYVFELKAPFQPYCAQFKGTSKPNCFPMLTAWDTTLATGSWDSTLIPRTGGAGVGDVLGIYIYTHGVGLGQSAFTSSTSFGTLCLSGFKRSAPTCPLVILAGAQPGVCNLGVMSLDLNCNGGALGIAVGENVNVQLWYRDPGSPGDSGFSNAIFYTVQ